MPGVQVVSAAAFADLAARMGRPPEPPPDPAQAAIRLRRLLGTDPAGAWVAERNGAVCGCSLGIVREGIWGLSLLVVHPGAQSAGVGRELLARAHAHGQGARGFIVLASPDPRALRSYVGLGLDLHPSADARGHPRGVLAPPEVRPWRAEDRQWTDAVGRAVRGAAHGDDMLALAAGGATLSVLPGRGYVAARNGVVKLLAATDDEAACALLRAHLAAAGQTGALVEWLTSGQQWAVRTCVAAGLGLEGDGGAVLTAGDVGPMRPYLPSGAYL